MKGAMKVSNKVQRAFTRLCVGFNQKCSSQSAFNGWPAVLQCLLRERPVNPRASTTGRRAHKARGIIDTISRVAQQYLWG